MEHMSGSDAVLFHMEDDETPVHTLKVVVLDPSRRGRPVTLDDIALAVGSRLGMVPRATQKVVAAPGFGGRPFWVDDVDFELKRHLDERTVAAPGDGAQLDAVYSDLASEFLPRDRPLWAMTLVHGLEGGCQAIVVRVHHAVADGLGALHTFLAATTDEPGQVAPIEPAVIGRAPSRRRLAVTAAGDAIRTWRALPALARDVAAARRSVRPHRNDPDIPSFIQFGRTSLNRASGAARTCATGSLDLATVRAVGKATDTTVNGVLHALIAGAVRAELAARGEDISRPTIASFGIATDPSDTERRYGNQVTPTFVWLHSELGDARARLEATARSCRVAVDVRRAAGLDLTDAFSARAPRLLNAFRRTAAKHTTMNPTHIVTANVAGPRSRRWLGDIEVVDWFSFAIAMLPASVNVTVHSYDGRMNIGLVADPAAMPEPRAFIDRVTSELEVLAEATSVAMNGAAATIRS